MISKDKRKQKERLAKHRENEKGDFANPNHVQYRPMLLHGTWYVSCENIYSTLHDLWICVLLQPYTDIRLASELKLHTAL